MNIWKRISRLSLKQFLKLSLLFARNPLLIIPTLKATKEAMSICDDLFGRSHHLSNRANAFRHAIWNILISEKTLKHTKNAPQSVIWAEKFTNLYEKVTQNDPLDEAMDLHNNEIGRSVFLEKNGIKTQDLIDFMLKKMENAQKIATIEDIEHNKNELVYIEEI